LYGVFCIPEHEISLQKMEFIFFLMLLSSEGHWKPSLLCILLDRVGLGCVSQMMASPFETSNLFYFANQFMIWQLSFLCGDSSSTIVRAERSLSYIIHSTDIRTSNEPLFCGVYTYLKFCYICAIICIKMAKYYSILELYKD